MLRTMVNNEKNVGILKNDKLKAYIKQINIGYRPKKAKVFTPMDLKKFFLQAPDEEYLTVKVKNKNL